MFLKEFFEKVNFEKGQQTTKQIMEKLPSMQKVKYFFLFISFFLLHFRIVLSMDANNMNPDQTALKGEV